MVREGDEENMKRFAGYVDIVLPKPIRLTNGYQLLTSPSAIYLQGYQILLSTSIALFTDHSRRNRC